MIAAILSGDAELPPLPDPHGVGAFHDPELTQDQRQVVLEALNQDGLYLVVGAPGTGKTRVIAEIVTQAVSRGWKTLVTAPAAQALEACLRLLRDRIELLPVYFPEASARSDMEAPAQGELPEAVTSRGGWIKSMAERTCAARRAELHRQRERFLLEGSLVADMARLVERFDAVEARRQALLQALSEIRAGVDEEVERVNSGQECDTPLGRHLAGEEKRHAACLLELEQRLAVARQRCQQCLQEAAAWKNKVQAQEAVVEQRKRGNPLSLRFWLSLFQGRASQRLEEFRQRAREAQAAADAACSEHESLQAARSMEVQRHQTAREQIVADEIGRRLAATQEQLDQATHEHEQIVGQWLALRRRWANPEAIPPTPSREALADLSRLRQQEEQQLQRWERFLGAWQEVLETGPPLSGSLAALANPVLACVSSLLRGSDPNSGLCYDLVVVDQADRLDDQQLRAIAALGWRCVLVGYPPPWAALPARSSQAGPMPLFYRLWHRLRPGLQHTDCQWLETEHEVICRLLAAATLAQGTLESERLADQPEVELRILNVPQHRPLLAEVVFPRKSFALPQAKQFLYRQLGELPLRPEFRHWHWREDTAHLILELSPPLDADRSLPRNASAAPDEEVFQVELEPGVTEWVAPRLLDASQQMRHWCTRRLVFSRSHGWNGTAAAAWLKEKTGISGLRRTGWLRINFRCQPALDRFVLSCMVGEPAIPCAEGEGAEAKKSRADAPALRVEAAMAENLSRPATAGGKSRGLEGGRAGSKGQLDLSDPKQRQRLPLDLQLRLPMRGQIHLAEAERVVMRLQELDGTSSRHETGQIHVAVLSWSQPQVQVIEHLWAKAEKNGRLRVVFATVPGFRECEADMVLLSLARSDGPRSQPYAEHLADWWTALGSARERLIVIGDTLALQYRSRGERLAACQSDPLASLEKHVCRQLLGYFRGTPAKADSSTLGEVHLP